MFIWSCNKWFGVNFYLAHILFLTPDFSTEYHCQLFHTFYYCFVTPERTAIGEDKMSPLYRSVLILSLSSDIALKSGPKSITFTLWHKVKRWNFPLFLTLTHISNMFGSTSKFSLLFSLEIFVSQSSSPAQPHDPSSK